MYCTRNKLVSFLILILLFAGSSKNAVASHSMGSDITYRCLGNNQYEVTLSFYRDCAGIPADSAAWISFSSSCYPTGNTIIYLIPGTGREISPVCPSEVSTCNGGTFTGIQEYIYRGIITLPGPCADWTFSYNLCCRNNAITNIDFPGNTLMYVYATLNNTITPCNNSPTFSNLPVPFVCLGQLYCYNHGAYDADGDSLVYSLITPFDSPGLPVQYNFPFSATNPLSSIPATSFNSSNGDICMTPSNLEVTVMAVLVSEYRNGVLIGSVERDIQITVINCNNVLPTLTGVNGTNSFSQSVCAGNQICFTVYSADPDGLQNTIVSWDNSIPGATFTTLPGHRESGTFCWTPQQSDISSNPYCFTVNVQDDNCPYLGSQVYSYCITVNGLFVNAGPDLSVGCNSASTVTATASGGNGNYSYQWNNGMTTSSISGGPGSYIVTASDGVCTAKDTVQILAGTSTPTAAFSMVYNCSGLNVQFNNQSTIVAGTISGYTWNFGDGNNSTATSPSHNYAAAGNYQITLIVQSAGGCLDTVVQMLHLSNDQPLANFSLQNACLGTQINFTDQSTSNSAISTWSWNFGDGALSNIGNPAHTYTVAGNYNVSMLVINANGCRDSITIPLTIFPLPIPFAGNNVSMCEGDSVHLSGTGGVSYLWNPGNITTASTYVTPTLTTTYTLSVTDANGCEAMDDVTVQVNSNPVLNPIPNRSICIGASTTLSANATGNVVYSWSPGGAATQQLTVNPASSTTYHVTATNANGCLTSDSVRVTVNALPVISVTTTDALCFGSSDGTLKVLIVSGSAPYTYAWSPAGGTAANATGLPAGTYTIEVTDTNGCKQTATSTIAQSPQINLSPNATPTLCFGSVNGSASVVASGGTPSYSYLWSPGGSTLSTATGLAAGNYTVTVVDSHACSKSSTINVSQPSALNLATSSVAASCFGSSNGIASVLANGGTPAYGYSWSPVSGTAANLSGLAAGTYSVIVTDANACSSTTSVIVSEPTVIQLSSSSTPASCSTTGNGSATVVASGGVAGYNYSWSPSGGTNANAPGLIPGLYTVRVTDSKGCSTTTTVTVGSIGGPAITPSTQTNVSCQGGNNGAASVNISAGTPPYSISWSPIGGTTASAVNLTVGNYTVNVTDVNGCLATYQVSITEPPLLVASIAETDVSCFGLSDGTVTVDVLGGVQPYYYSWQPAVSSSRNSLNVVAGNYAVIVTDAQGCTQSVSTTVSQPSALNLIVSSVDLLCHSDTNGSATAAITGGSPGYTYSWSPGGGTAANCQGLSQGTYTVTVTDSHACTALASTTIHEPPALAFSVSPQSTLCIGQSTTIGAAASGGTSPYFYSWNTGETDSSHLVSPQITTLYSVQVMDANGCNAGTQAITVNVNPPLAVVASNQLVICEGDPAQISALASGGNGGPYNYSWNQGAISGSSNSVSPVNDSTFVVMVTDDCGTPPAYDSVQISVYPLPEVAFLPNEIHGCAPVNAIFNNYSVAPAGSNYFWNLGDQSSSTEIEPTHLYTQPGVYNVSLTIVSPEGCTATLSVPRVVNVFGFPSAGFSQSSTEITISNPGISFSDESTDAVYWEWDFGDGSPTSFEPNPVHEYLDSGTYVIRQIVHSSGGCADTLYNTLRVEMEFIIYVPNVFTPNGDGVNDTFIAKGIGYTDFSLWILDRWGKKIYHSNNRYIPWDGTYYGNGNQCQADVYEWVLDVVDFKGNDHRLIGHVTLAR